MSNGAISNSRWGLRGSEDLGDGNRAFFRLEQGFDVQNGKSSSSGKTFNRLAYVGLDGGKIGALTLGLQNTVIQDLMADHFDPLTVGNYAENSWLPVAMGRVRADNAFRYANTLGDLAVIGQWSMVTSGRTAPPASKWVSACVTRSASSAWVVLSRRPSGPTTRTSVSRCGTSAPRISSKSSRSSPAISTAGSDQLGQRHHGPRGGQQQHPGSQGQRLLPGRQLAGATPRWTITGAAYYDQAKNVVVDGDKGKRYALIAVAEYALSKRTQVYGTVDYNKVRDASTGDISGRTSQVGGGLGIRHIF